MAEESTRSSYFSKKVSVCPVCSTNFSREDLLTGRGRLIAGEITRELRRHYEPSKKFGEVFPLVYPVTVCPNCRFAAYPQDFAEVPEKSLPQLIDGTEQRQASLETILPSLDFFAPRGPKEGAASYYYAVMCYDSFPKEFSPTIKQGLSALRAAWLFQDLHRQTPGENYDYLSLLMYRKAGFFYNLAVEKEQEGKEPVGGMSALGPDLDKNYGYDGVLYLSAYLSLYHGPTKDPERRQKALISARRTVAKIFGMGKASKDKPEILLNLAKDLYDKFSEEVKEEETEQTDFEVNFADDA